MKVRIRNTREATVGAVIGPIERPDRLVLGLHTAAGEPRVAGATRPLTTQEAVELGRVLTRAEVHPWPAELDTRHLGRFRRAGSDHARAPTLVVEVEADTAFEHGRWRHLTRYRGVRWDLCG